jgi:hypothetical protein
MIDAAFRSAASLFSSLRLSGQRFVGADERG